VSAALSTAALAAAVAVVCSVPSASPAASSQISAYLAQCINLRLNPPGYDWLIRPRSCILAGAHWSFGTAANLTGLRWSSWGGAVARGTGIERGFHLPPSRIPVTVQLSLPVTPDSDRSVRVYRRFRVTSRFGTLAGTTRRP
jgi:hypothetical protein